MQGSAESSEGSSRRILRASPNHSICGDIWSRIEENLPYACLRASWKPSILRSLSIFLWVSPAILRTCSAAH